MPNMSLVKTPVSEQEPTVRNKNFLEVNLGYSDDEAREEAEQLILREFKLWAENTMCDAARQQNFYGLQQLAFLSMLMSGDVFALFGMKENRRTPYQTTIRLLEADRICNPDSSGAGRMARWSVTKPETVDT